MKVHSVFHVSLLKPYQNNEISGCIQSSSFSVIVVTEEEESEKYEVEIILKIRLFYSKLQYLIR